MHWNGSSTTRNFLRSCTSALAHAQFEAIHPFLDGNGRIGRLLVTLLLVVRNVLPSPLLYLSAWFEATREEYYAHLLAVTRDGAWEPWLVYFLTGVCTQAEDALARIQDINDLHERWREELAGVQSGRSEQVLRLFVGNPFQTVGGVARELDVAYTTARRAIDRLEEAGIVSLVGAGKRNRVYCARAMLDILEASHAAGRPASILGPGSRRRCMSIRVSERAFEDAIEAALLTHGPDAIPATSGKVGEEPPPYHDPGYAPRRLPQAPPRGLRPSALPPPRTTSSTSCWRPSRSSGGGSRSITARRSGSGS